MLSLIYVTGSAPRRWFSRCGAGTSIFSLTWEGVGKADSQAPTSDELNQNRFGWGLPSSVFLASPP